LCVFRAAIVDKIGLNCLPENNYKKLEKSVDIVTRALIVLSCMVVVAAAVPPLVFGFSLYALAFSVFVLLFGYWILYLANTPFRANRYRKLETPWTDKAGWKEYPRPQLQREHWINLNGTWQCAIQSKNKLQDQIESFDLNINVPFPVESLLSGVEKKVGAKNKLWYRRTYEKPETKNGRLRLHFGAVDWETEVWVNGQYAGKHQGGHNAFYFDIESFLNEGKEQEVVVSVWDPTSSDVQPRGKQSNRPSNIYYMPVTGIWQTVWLEPLPEASVANIRYQSDIDERRLDFDIALENFQEDDKLFFKSLDAEFELELLRHSGKFSVNLPENIVCWETENPRLYDFQLSIIRGDKVIDSVNSYFALRKVEIKADKKGFNRIFVNNKAVFQLGLLDQGWWPDGLYTPPNEEALRYDIEVSKAMGFNVIRKHVKIEPALWYYYCDLLGVLVWQDMPTGDKNVLPKQKDIVRSPKSKEIFFRELDVMMNQLDFFQSLICWVPFNEGWGQFDTNNVLSYVKQKDASRLVDGPSGWNDRGQGDMRDYHIYNRKLFVGSQKPGRAEVVGEFGGLGYRLEEHMAVTNSWSYKSKKSAEELHEAYQNLMEQELQPLFKKGLAGAIYTQTTDVESEINGLLTYDRKVNKIGAQTLGEIHKGLFRAFDAEV
jgi:hypothetical protein